jgi:isocitrate dehydrogenase (NAD+)
MGYPVTLIRGDGIGPEVAAAAKTVIDATGVAIDWQVMDAGANQIEPYGTPLPQLVLDSIRQTRTVLKAPTITPVDRNIRSVDVELCTTFNLYASIRPAKSLAGVKSYFQNMDLVIIREHTEDFYAGVEFERTTSEAAEAREFLSRLAGKRIREDSAIGVKPISVLGSWQVVDLAFRHAVALGRQKVTVVHKANIMPYTDGLFVEVARSVAQDYPSIEFEETILDTLCVQLLQRPGQYDVLVTPNLYGDILADICAGMVGGLSVVPTAHVGHDCVVFEAIHGAEPDLANQDHANPTALILAGAMMLEHLGEIEAAQKLKTAVELVIAEKKYVTADLSPLGKPAGTAAMTQAIIKLII